MTEEQFQNAVLGLTVEGTINSAWELYKRSQHALWMARVERAKCEQSFYEGGISPYALNVWRWVERKCREKAKEFE